MFKLTIMTGHFASEASGPQNLQKYILRDFYASSLGKKTFLKVSVQCNTDDLPCPQVAVLIPVLLIMFSVILMISPALR